MLGMSERVSTWRVSARDCARRRRRPRPRPSREGMRWLGFGLGFDWLSLVGFLDSSFLGNDGGGDKGVFDEIKRRAQPTNPFSLDGLARARLANLGVG